MAPWKTMQESLLPALGFWDLRACLTFPSLHCLWGPGLQTVSPGLFLGSANGGISVKLKAINWQKPENFCAPTPPAATSLASAASPSLSLALHLSSFSLSLSHPLPSLCRKPSHLTCGTTHKVLPLHKAHFANLQASTFPFCQIP